MSPKYLALCGKVFNLVKNIAMIYFGGSEGLAAKETIIQSEINTIVNGYTLDEFNTDGYQNVKDDILKSMQDMFGGSDFIVGVNFSSVQTE